MNYSFDHLVHFVEETSDVITSLKKLGIQGVEGGVHQNYGTRNMLSYFDLSYIEFLTTYDRELVKQLDHYKYSLMETIVNDHFEEGFSRFAIRTTDIEATAKKLANKGLDVTGPMPLSRKRPDGRVIDWQLLFVGSSKEELPLPFIIQWNESDEERRKDLISRKVIVPHPAGVSFSHVSFAVKNAQETANKWASYFDLTPGEEYIDENLQARCKALKLKGGHLVFCSPIGEGIVSHALEKRGETIFQVNLSGGLQEESIMLFGGNYRLTPR